MQITAVESFRQLVQLTAPGAPVAPVIAELDSAVRSIVRATPELTQAHASAQLLDDLDRIRGSAATLRNTLQELVTNDGMSTFDAAFAADDPDWDAKFSGWATALAAAEVAG